MNNDMKKIKSVHIKWNIKYLKFKEIILDFLKKEDDIVEDYKRNNSKYYTWKRRYM